MSTGSETLQTPVSEKPRWRRLADVLDPVWCLALSGPIVLLAAAPDLGQEVALFTVRNLWETLPFIFASVAMAAAAKASGADAIIAKAFQGRTSVMVVLAALIGALSPFCSCGVIPLIAALLAMGVPLAPVMAFWLSSPVMDPSMFVLTTGVLGLEFAIAKTVAAIGLGLLGGTAVSVLSAMGGLQSPLRPGVGNGGCAGRSVRAPKPVAWSFWQAPERRSIFARESRRNLLFLGKWLTLAFGLEAMMIRFVPAETVAQLVGGEGVWPVVAATVIGIPAYLNGYAALPLVGGLVEQGMAPGAAMAFLVSGGVTSIPAAIAVYALARPPLFGVFLTVALLGSLAAGLVFGLAA